MQNEDQGAIDLLIAQFFQVFDNRSGQTPDFSIMAQLLLPAVVIHKIDLAEIEGMNLASFLAPRVQLFESGQLTGFHEWETENQTIINGHLASRISYYAKSGQLNGQLYQGSGVKHFQLVKKPAGWQIAAMIWQDD